MTTTELRTHYFEGEGRSCMKDCLHHAAEWCASKGIDTLVIFTGTGEGPQYAAAEMLMRDRYKSLKVVAVTPPSGRTYKTNPADPNSSTIQAGINPGLRDALEQLGIRVVSAHLPFKDIYGARPGMSELSRIADAFGILGGGFALCVQAVLIACDAGWVTHGQDVVVAAADTALVVTACRTESFLSPTEGLLVGHIICRPARYNISKQHHEAIAAPRELSQGLPPASHAAAQLETPVDDNDDDDDVPPSEPRPKPRKRTRTRR